MYHAPAVQQAEDKGMPSVYQRAGSPYWWGKYKGFDGRWWQESTGIRVAADNSKYIARALVLEKEMDHALIARGKIDPQEYFARQKGRAVATSVVDEFLETVAEGQARNNHASIVRDFLESSRVLTCSEFGGPGIVGKVSLYIELSRRAGNSIGTTNKKLWAIQRFGNWLADHGYIRANETLKLHPMKGHEPRKVLHRAFTPEEAERLVGGDCGLFYGFRLWTGLRGSEAVQIERRDLDLSDKPTLTVRPEITKNGYGCVVPLAHGLAEKLAEACSMLAPNAEVFAEIPKRRDTRRKWFSKHVDAAQLPAELLNARSFRMTHTTWLKLAGLDSETIGTLRRDRGQGSKLLQRWNYSDYDQLMPYLREQLARVEHWYAGELAKREVKKA